MNQLRLRMVLFRFDQLQIFIGKLQPSLQVVDDISFDITVNDNIWLATTTDKQMDFRKKTFVSRKQMLLLQLWFFN